MNFSNSTNVKNPLQKLLEEELDCLQQILAETKKFIEQSDSYTIEAIVDLLNTRDQWIYILQRLQAEKEKVKGNMEETDLSYLTKEITGIAQNLVVIDAKIFDILQTKKMETIKEMANIVNKHSRSKEKRSSANNRSRIVDIVQE